MASQVEGWIGRINPGDGLNYAIGSTAYGVCESAATATTKVVDMTGFVLTEGATIHVWFKNGNTATTYAKLNVNGTGEKTIASSVTDFTYEGQTMYVSDQVSGLKSLKAGTVVEFTYCKGYWIVNTTNGVDQILHCSITSAFSSLPFTIQTSRISAQHVVLRMVLSNPDAQVDDWSVHTFAGGFTVRGTISGSTKATIDFGIASDLEAVVS